MVRTRSGDALPDTITSEMPVKHSPTTQEEPEDDKVTVSSLQRESSEEKDLTYRPGWGRELRNRFVFGRKRRAKRDLLGGSGMRASYPQDELEEDDLEESRDEMFPGDDSDDIFPRRGPPRRDGRRRLSLRHRASRHHARSSRATDMNGMATPDGKSGAGNQAGDGIRRSTRARKQKYDNFNNTWIDGMNGHQPLRGYPSPFTDKPAKMAASEGEEGFLYVSDAKEDKEEEEEEEEGRGLKRGRTLADLDATGGGLEAGDDLDMYSRVKRLRRPAKRFMFDEEAQNPPGRIEDNQTETQSSQTSTDDESEDKVRVAKYCLRKTKPAVDRFQATIDPPRSLRSSRVMRSMLRRHCPRPSRRGRSSSNSSSEDERPGRRVKPAHKTLASRCLPTPMNLESVPGDPKSSGNALADVDPMSLDRSIMFANVGGLEDHIRCLKEMVVFPMLYPEVFDRFHIQPAKGVLFHGLPGTGKTLLARALANECSQGDRKVAFFMRKGADCLTKWVGESERQLRLLFDQAYQMRPSIIFFDEIDGLAPVRSSKQDQIHASIVSTLLALMDGLDSRGEVVVIGATNRIDAIDPALRRPGRFDRELYFPLPATQERQEILRIHVAQWDTPPPAPLLSSLAEEAAGYCGSDLRALCSEAVLQGLRRRYPQIYKCSQKLLLDHNSVTVERQDFVRARSTIVPAANRCSPSAARKLPALMEPLLGNALSRATEILGQSFPHGLSRHPPGELTVHRPHLLVDGTSAGQGQGQLGPALLSLMEHVAVHTLDLSTLFHSAGQTPEEACIQTFNEARRNPPSVLFVPSVCTLWQLTSDTLHAVFLSKLRDLDPASPVLLLATSDQPHATLPHEIRTIFSLYRGEVLTLTPPDLAARRSFLAPLLLEETLLPPRATRVGTPHEEVLPLAPPPAPPRLTEDQQRAVFDQEEATLRELRIFLRDCCSKLARNRLFFMFTKPVDVDEVADYLHIIKQPMDLETMMTKIDLHRYACAQEFLDDIDLVVRNALEYNPDRTGEDKLIRHRACCLRDTAYALIKAEMDTDYEDKCKKISVSRRQRSDSPSRFVPEFIRTVTLTAAGGRETVGAAPPLAAPLPPPAAPRPPSLVNGLAKRRWHAKLAAKRRKHSSWSRGFVKTLKRPAAKAKTDTETPESSVREGEGEIESAVPEVKSIDSETAECVKPDEASGRATPLLNGCEDSPPVEPNIKETTQIVLEIEKYRLTQLLDRAAAQTDGCSVEQLLDLRAGLAKQVALYSDKWDRLQLPGDLSRELDRFLELQRSTDEEDV